MAAMVSSGRLVFLSAIWIFIAGAIAGPTIRGYSCPDNQGNYTSGSAYKANLNLILSSVSSNSTGLIEYGFYNSSYGEDPDKVYVIGLCRGDFTPDVCLNYLNFSKDDLIQRCPTQKEAIAWYDECMLRYSSRNIFSTMEDAPELPMGNTYNVSDEAKAQFNDQLLSLLESLRDRASAGGFLSKFAVGQAPAPNFSTIYALVQCTPDLSELDCNYCLSGAVRDFWKYHAGEVGGRILRPSCNFRYETYGFYNSTAEAPPPSPPPSGKGSHKSRTTIIIVGLLVAFVVIAIFISIYFILKKRREKTRRCQLLNPTTTITSTSKVAATPSPSSNSHLEVITSTSKAAATLSPSSDSHCEVITSTFNTAATPSPSFDSHCEVFLNFRGDDTRKNFVDHLYYALKRVGIRPYRDDKELPRGATISTELINAIQGSRIAIVVFSQGYASSTWCLDELAEIVDCRKTRGQILLPVFYHMDPSDIRRHTETFAKAFAMHEEQFQTDMERVKRWKEALSVAANCSGFDPKSIANGHESEFIDKIVEDVICKLKSPS